MGVYTDSKRDEYCFTYPWLKSGFKREVSWHSFTFVGSDSELKMYIDEEFVNSTQSTEFSSMFIAGGNFVTDQVTTTKGFWDSLLVTARYEGVSMEISEEEAVFFAE